MRMKKTESEAARCWHYNFPTPETNELPCASVSKRVLVRNRSRENVLPLQVNFHANQSFSQERFFTRLAFETGAEVNSKMFYYRVP